MTNETYNGWTNRETWLVNLYFGETLQDETKEFMISAMGEDIDLIQREEIEAPNKYELSEHLKDYFEDLIEEDLNELSSFLNDFIDLSTINFIELAENYMSEL